MVRLVSGGRVVSGASFRALCPFLRQLVDVFAGVLILLGLNTLPRMNGYRVHRVEQLAHDAAG